MKVKNIFILYLLLTVILAYAFGAVIAKYSVHNPYIETDGHNCGGAYIIFGMILMSLINLVLFIPLRKGYPIYVLLCSFFFVVINSCLHGERSAIINIPNIVAAIIIYNVCCTRQKTKKIRLGFAFQELFYLLSWAYAFLCTSYLLTDYAMTSPIANKYPCMDNIICITFLSIAAIHLAWLCIGFIKSTGEKAMK